MRYNPWSYCDNLQNYTRDVVQKTTFKALPSFRVSTWKKRSWSKRNDLFNFGWKRCTAHVKNDFNNFEREISTFKIVNALVNQKKWKTRSWSKFWMRILAKLNWNLQVSSINNNWSMWMMHLKKKDRLLAVRNGQWYCCRITPGPTKQERLQKSSQT